MNKTSLIYNLFSQKLKKQNKAKPLCLFSDLDDTYLLKFKPPAAETQKLTQKQADLLIGPNADLYRETVILDETLTKYHIPLCLVSGRDFWQFRNLKEEFQKRMPIIVSALNPDVYIGAVGTEIWVQQDEKYLPDHDFQKLVQQVSGFNRASVYALAQKVIAQINSLHPAIKLRFQKRDRIAVSANEYPSQPLKISLEFESVAPQAISIQRELQEILSIYGQDKIKTVLSWQRFTADNKINAYNLDLLACSKNAAVNYLVDRFNLFALTAGDSGNDAEMLFETKSYPIIVGGYKPELREYLEMAKKSQAQPYYLETGALKGPASINQALLLYLKA